MSAIENVVTSAARARPRAEVGATRPAPGPRGPVSSVKAAIRMVNDFLPFLCELDAAYSGPDMSPVSFDVMGQPMALVTHPEHVKEVLTDSEVYTRAMELFARRPMYMGALKRALGRNLLTTPNDEWRPMRRRTAGYFDPAHVEHYGAKVVEAIEKRFFPIYAERARRGEAMDLLGEMLAINSTAVFMGYLGDEVDEPEREITAALDEVFGYLRRNLFTPWLPPRWIPTPENRALNQNLGRARAYVSRRIARRAGAESQLGEVIRAHTVNGRVDEGAALDEIISNLMGATETTIVLMTWTFYYVMQHPEVARGLREEIDRVLGGRSPTVPDLVEMPYLNQVVSEALRLRSPSYITPRLTTRDTTLGGYAMKAGAIVFVSQYLTHRHPKVWKDPEVFRPERFAADSPEAPANRKHELPFFPFGAGGFKCLGLNQAVNGASLVTAALLSRFEIDAADPEILPRVGFDSRITLRPDRPIRVRVRVRAPDRIAVSPARGGCPYPHGAADRERSPAPSPSACPFGGQGPEPRSGS
jgi:cytochrome P450